MSCASPFKIMGVQSNASQHEIRKRFSQMLVHYFRRNWRNMSDEKLLAIRIEVAQITASFHVLTNPQMRRLFEERGDSGAAWDEAKRLLEISGVDENATLENVDIKNPVNLHATLQIAEQTVRRIWGENNIMFNIINLGRADTRLIQNKMNQALKWLYFTKLKRPGMSKFIIQKTEALVKECNEGIAKIRAKVPVFDDQVRRYKSDTALLKSVLEAIGSNLIFVGSMQTDLINRITCMEEAASDLDLIKGAALQDVNLINELLSTEKNLDELRRLLAASREQLSMAGLLADFKQAVLLKGRRLLQNRASVNMNADKGCNSGLCWRWKSETLKRNLTFAKKRRLKTEKFVRLATKRMNMKKKMLNDILARRMNQCRSNCWYWGGTKRTTP